MRDNRLCTPSQVVADHDCTIEWPSTSACTAASLGNVGLLLRDQSKLEEALPLLQRALAICERVHGTGIALAEAFKDNVTLQSLSIEIEAMYEL